MLRALPSAQPSNTELPARSVEEPEAFATLFDRHAPAVHRYRGRRIGVGITVAAVAWTAAVVIAAPHEPGNPPGSVTLVAFDVPTLPLSLDPVPAGMRPAFSGDGGSSSFADYRSVDGENRFTIGLDEDEPEWLQDEYESYDIAETDEVSVGDTEAQFVRGSYDYYCEDGLTVCERRSFADLVLERQDDQWVSLRGEGATAPAPRLWPWPRPAGRSRPSRTAGSSRWPTTPIRSRRGTSTCRCRRTSFPPMSC